MTASTDKNEMKIANALWFYFFSKAIEFMDTIFMVVRKRFTQITFLHVFHHSTMLIIWWIVMTWIPVSRRDRSLSLRTSNRFVVFREVKLG
jgi:hypothetical protein